MCASSPVFQHLQLHTSISTPVCDEIDDDGDDNDSDFSHSCLSKVFHLRLNPAPCSSQCANSLFQRLRSIPEKLVVTKPSLLQARMLLVAPGHTTSNKKPLVTRASLVVTSRSFLLLVAMPLFLVAMPLLLPKARVAVCIAVYPRFLCFPWVARMHHRPSITEWQVNCSILFSLMIITILLLLLLRFGPPCRLAFSSEFGPSYLPVFCY